MENLALKKELSRLKEIRDDNHWDSVRNKSRFRKDKIQTPTGERVVWVPKDNAHNKDLQSSRSVGLGGVETIEDLEASYSEGMKLTHTDTLRAEEVDELIHTLNKFGGSQGLPKISPTKMCEIGFRYPRLMSFYSDRYNIPAIGYDISTLAVEFGASKGFDVRECDLNNLDQKPLELKDSNIICMYHVLEHVKNPILTLRAISKAMPKMGIIHIEVPIEGENPQVEYGHLFGFHPGDLPQYCQFAGLNVVACVTKNIAGAIFVERVACLKNE